MHYGDWNDGWGGGWWWLPMMVAMLAFWGGLVALVVVLLRRTGPTSPASTPMPPVAARPSAEEILAERLARGDIEPDDYRLRLEALKGRS